MSYARYNGLSGGGGSGGVTSLNGETGAVVLIGGTGVTVVPSGQNITINSSGATSVGPFGSTPNADGGDITAGVLTLEPADGTHPGGLSITTQTIAGAKTLTSPLSMNAPQDALFLSMSDGSGGGYRWGFQTGSGGQFGIFDTQGAYVLQFSNSTLNAQLFGTLSIGGNGSAAAAGLYWGGDYQTGFYHTTSVIGITIAGTQVAQLDATGIHSYVEITTPLLAVTTAAIAGATPAITLLNPSMSAGDGAAIDFYAGSNQFNARIHGYAVTINTGRLVFATCNASTTPIDAMTIDENQIVNIGAANQFQVNASGIMNISTTSAGTISLAQLENNHGSAGDGEALDFLGSGGSFNARVWGEAVGLNSGNLHLSSANGTSFADVIELTFDGQMILGTPSTTVQHTLNTAVGTNASGILTLSNAPAGVSGNPTGYVQITINGGTHYIPYW